MVELEKQDYEAYESYEEVDHERLLEEKMKEDLHYEKGHEDFLYKILKYNPIDFLNEQYREVVRRLDIEFTEQRLQWWFATFYVKLLGRVMWNFKFYYPKGNMFPEYGPGIVVSNHQSHIDPFFCGMACHRKIRFMSKLDNFKTPIVKSLFTNLGAFKLDRDNPALGWKQAKKIIEQGEWVGIFPEGTRSKDSELGQFKTGAIRLAIETGVPIVPMAIIGSDKALPKGGLMMKPTRVFARVGDPIYYDKFDSKKMTYEDIRKLTDELRTTVFELREGTYGKTEEELAEMAQAPPKEESFNIKRWFKDFMMGTLWTIDDIWYSFLRSLEEFNLREQYQKFIYTISGEIVHNLNQTMIPYKVIDYDKYLPKTGPAVLCTTHNSEWDVILLATSIIYNPPRRIIYQMSKQSLFKIPIVNAWIRNHHAFPLKRGQHDVDSYNFARDLLDKGHLVCIYPEGTTNLGGGELLEGHTGAMRLAIEKQVPIALIGITGTEDTYPKHAKMLNFYRGSILRAGPPFMEHQQYWGKKMPEYDELKRLTNNMMAQLKNLLMYDDKEV
ncbi:MAG: 1-acyl-sn-glycerol-3-phosphate acyltransferase [Promethearchaeota archaeon]|nr:MAG: 1-acyl-sn-glycerol-3-phosphate acyltransferase [Candidatus Lokiarchaeota archaeon]